MTVYVDNAMIRFGRMRMSHMIADTEDELHTMASRIGLKRCWFQGMASTPHYDVCAAKRSLAVHFGAVQLDRRGMVVVIRRLRNGRHDGCAT